jgi:hypothetical protein
MAAHTGAMAQTLWGKLNTAAISSGRELSGLANKAAFVGTDVVTKAACVGAKVAVVSLQVAAHVAVHALKKQPEIRMV